MSIANKARVQIVSGTRKSILVITPNIDDRNSTCGEFYEILDIFSNLICERGLSMRYPVETFFGTFSTESEVRAYINGAKDMHNKMSRYLQVK